MSRRVIALAAAILIAAPVAILSGQETSTSGENKAQVKKVPAPYTRATDLSSISL
jgi:curli biogenesis system outer membrane secretion channel CsgG